MKTRALGGQGLVVSELGLGCMGMSEFYGTPDDVESIATIHRALDLGVTLFDTADIYGPFRNEELLGRALQGKRHRAVIATKFGTVRGHDGAFVGVDGSPAHVRRSAEGSLRRLGVETIDLYIQHRVDPNVPIEDTVGAMAELVREGKVRYLGLSEAAVPTIWRAHMVSPLSVIESEYSLWTRDPEDELFPTLRELGIGFVAASPLGRGFLTGQIRSPEDLAAHDRRRQFPRFGGENFEKNLSIVGRVQAIAEKKGVTPTQLALAWLLARGPDVVPIPGTERRTFLDENVIATGLTLSPQDLAEIDAALPRGAAAGERYPDMSVVNR